MSNFTMLVSLIENALKKITEITQEVDASKNSEKPGPKTGSPIPHANKYSNLCRNGKNRK